MGTATTDFLVLREYYIAEINAEAIATRHCLERIPPSTYKFKPHEKSMLMGDLTQLVAEIPRWISSIIDDSVIDLAGYPHVKLSDTEGLLKSYEDNLTGAIRSLSGMTEKTLQADFVLKAGDKIMMKSPKLEAIGSTINHWVHHRGQLTVYMRLNDILVPSIYGPSADEKTY